jgi:AraC-like DNA-binding protein
MGNIASGLLMDLYLGKPTGIQPESCDEHIIADRICSDILSSIAEDCVLDDIFSRYNINKYKANRIFKKRYDDTPYSFLRKHRLYAAAGMLILGKRNMKQIASAIKYESESKFAIAFKAQFGVRPKHFLSYLTERYNNVFDKS